VGDRNDVTAAAGCMALLGLGLAAIVLIAALIAFGVIVGNAISEILNAIERLP